MSTNLDQKQPMTVDGASTPKRAEWKYLVTESQDEDLHSRVVTIVTMCTNGIDFSRVTRKYQAAADEVLDYRWEPDDEDAFVSEEFAPTTLEPVLRCYVRPRYDGGQELLDDLDAIRLGMNCYEYKELLKAQAKKAKAIDRAERKLAKLKAQ